MRYAQKVSDQNFMLLLLPSEDIDFLHCSCIDLHLVPLHLVLVKSKLDKAVITHVVTYDFWIPSPQVL